MYLDAKNMFSDKQAITVTASSTEKIDMNADAAFGVAKLPFFVQVGKTFGGTGNLTVSLELSDKENFSSKSEFELAKAVPVANLKAGVGFLYKGTIPEHVKWQYARLVYTVAGGTLSTGFVNAGILQESGY